jgi:hypothetical protein
MKQRIPASKLIKDRIFLNSLKMGYFKASMDRTAKIITVVFILFTAALVMSMFWLNGDKAVDPARIIAPAILVITLAVCYGYAPKGYSAENGVLLIHRPIRNRKIPFNHIESAQPLERLALKSSIRTFGVGGLFGYWGKYYSPAIGAANWYLTQRQNLLLVKLTTGEKILLSPDKAGLIEMLPVSQPINS